MESMAKPEQKIWEQSPPPDAKDLLQRKKAKQYFVKFASQTADPAVYAMMAGVCKEVCSNTINFRNPTLENAQFTPPGPTRLNSFVASGGAV